MYGKLACLTILLACAVGKPASAEIINFSTASDSGNTAPLWIAADLGFFEKYGNTVRLVFIQGATVSISALLNNDVHMAQFSPSSGGPRALRVRRSVQAEVTQPALRIR